MEPEISLASDGRRADFKSEWEVKNEKQLLTATETLFRTPFHVLLDSFLTYFLIFLWFKKKTKKKLRKQPKLFDYIDPLL